MAEDRGNERSHSAEDYAKSLEKEIRGRARCGSSRRRPPAAGIVIPALIIIVGILVFLDNFGASFGMFHIYNIWRLWPLALVCIGLSKMFYSQGWGGRLWAGIVTAAGAGLLLDSLGIWHMRWNLVWPLALVGIGVSMLIDRVERRNLTGGMRPLSSASAADTLREWATFSGIKRRLDTQNFQGGEMIAVFGGIEVDLRRANIANSGEVVIDANATFGGIELRVPETWTVITRGMGIFGGYEDKTIPPRPVEGVTPPRVLITGYAVFGGVSVQN